MSEMHKITAEEATVLSTFGYEQEEEGYVLCYPKGELTYSQEEVISTLVNKEILLPGDDKEDPYFWMHQSDYRVLYDLTDGFKSNEGKILKNTCMARAKARKEAKEAKNEAEKPTKVAWQDLMFQEFKDLITVEGLSMDAARDEMMVRTSRFLDVALFHFLELITNSKLSDL